MSDRRKGGPSEGDGRAARLGAALRANLGRRKARARALDEPDGRGLGATAGCNTDPVAEPRGVPRASFPNPSAGTPADPFHDPSKD